MILYDKNGWVTGVIFGSDDIQLGNHMLPDELAIEGNFAIPGVDRVEAGVLVSGPERPTGMYNFNKESRAWEFDVVGAWFNVRATRDRLLQACDWTQLPDVPLATKEAWFSYRQALRDITNQKDVSNIYWPTKP